MDHAVTDGMLVERAVLGDPDAFAELLRRHVDAVHDHLVRASGDAMAGLELTSDVLSEAMRDLGLLSDPESFRTWLLGRAARLGIAAGRRSTDARTAGPAAAALGARTFAVLDLTARHGLRTPEVASGLGMSHRTVERELHRATQALRGVGDVDAYTESPLLLAPDGYADRLWEHLAPRWSTTPPAPVRPRPLRDRRVVVAVVTAAAMLLLSVPVAVGLRGERAGLSALQAAPYTPPPTTPSPTPTAAEDIVLPAPTWEPQPEPEPSSEPAPEPQATPTPTPTPEPTPAPTETGPAETESPTESCGLLDLDCPASPSPSPQPSSDPSPEGPTSEPTSGETSGEGAAGS